MSTVLDDDGTVPHSGGHRVLFVHCHPAADSTVSRARDVAARAIERQGGQARHIDLYAESFDPVLSAWERRNHLGDPAGKPAIAALAEHGVDERAFVTQPEGETVVYRVP